MEISNFSIEILLFLFIISILAGLIDTLAGGGGLIALPALIISGMSPLAALATNKLQGTIGTATASYTLFTKKKISFAQCKYLMLLAFIGSIAGTITVQFIDTTILAFAIPFILLFTALYFLISPLSSPQIKTKSSRYYKKLVIPLIGFYDGMFGPGTGAFFTASSTFFRGYTIIKATAIAKPLNFATNIASVVIFIMAGHIVWSIGILMMVGQLIGARVGASILFKMKAIYLRFIVVTMCMAMLIKYCYTLGWLN